MPAAPLLAEPTDGSWLVDLKGDYHLRMTRRPQSVARITDAHRAAIANLTGATALVPAQRRREELLALGVAMGLERAAAICVELHRRQERLTGEAAEALTAAERIKSESLAWQEMSAEAAPITMPTPSCRGLRIVGIAQ